MSVSVVITCFNEGIYIKEAVQSVLSQTRQDLIVDVIIHDDGSETATLEILHQLESVDRRIKLIYGNQYGPSKARNLAAKEALGDWLAFLDGDDIWANDKIEIQWESVIRRPNTCLFYTGLDYFSDGKFDVRAVAKVADLTNSSDTALDYFNKDGPITSTILCRKKEFLAIGGYNEELRVFEDSEFYARFAIGNSFALCPEVLVHKRTHARSITGARKHLMAHHTKVAYMMAAANPKLNRVIPSRLALRAVKLGNVEIAAGNTKEALDFYGTALSFRPLWPQAILSYALVRIGFPLASVRSFVISLRRKRSRSLNI